MVPIDPWSTFQTPDRPALAFAKRKAKPGPCMTDRVSVLREHAINRTEKLEIGFLGMHGADCRNLASCLQVDLHPHASAAALGSLTLLV